MVARADSVTLRALGDEWLTALAQALGSSREAVFVGCATTDPWVALLSLADRFTTGIAYFVIGFVLARMSVRLSWLRLRAAAAIYGGFIFLCGLEHVVMAGRMIYPWIDEVVTLDVLAGQARAMISVIAAIYTVHHLSGLVRVGGSLAVLDREGRLFTRVSDWDAALGRKLRDGG